MSVSNNTHSGQHVLFNGASLLGSTRWQTHRTIDTPQGSPHSIVDPQAWRRYCALADTIALCGGIYVQEPDCAAASVAALTAWCMTHRDRLPLGFAYGHVPGVAAALPSLTGELLAVPSWFPCCVYTFDRNVSC